MFDADFTIQQAVLYAVNAPQAAIVERTYLPNDAAADDLDASLAHDIETAWAKFHSWVDLGKATRNWIALEFNSQSDDELLYALLTRAILEIEKDAEDRAAKNRASFKKLTVLKKRVAAISAKAAKSYEKHLSEVRKVGKCELDEISDFVLFLRALRAERFPGNSITGTLSTASDLDDYYAELTGA